MAYPPILPVVFRSNAEIPEMIEKMTKGKTTILSACSSMVPGNLTYSISSASSGGSIAFNPKPRAMPSNTPSSVSSSKRLSFSHDVHLFSGQRTLTSCYINILIYSLSVFCVRCLTSFNASCSPSFTRRQKDMLFICFDIILILCCYRMNQLLWLSTFLHDFFWPIINN